MPNFRGVKLNLNNPLHSFIWLTSAVTQERALYPREFYLLGGMWGMVDGIYDLEVENNSRALTYELIDDGV